MKLLYWLEWILFNNPTICEKCISMQSTYDLQYLKRESSGFNKNHTHKRTKESIDKEIEMAYATAAPEVGKYYWHVHHQVLVERLTEPAKNRVDYIKSNKMGSVETRLHFMRPVTTVPPQVQVANQNLERAQKVAETVYKAYSRGRAERTAWTAASMAVEKAKSVLASPIIKAAWEAQHRKECFHYCPWNGTTLLPKVAQGKV